MAEREGDERVLVYANPNETGVRMTTIFAVSTLVFSLFLAVYVFERMAARVGEGLAPLGERIAWAAAIAAVGIAFFVTMWRHMHHVTARIWHVPRTDTLEVENMGLFKHSVSAIDLRDLQQANFHRGDVRGEQSGTAPYVKLAARGGTFIVNLPGEIYRTDIFARVLDAAGLDPHLARRRAPDLDRQE